jgi:hypothetical protein
MRTIYIIGEGQTEEEFIKESLSPYLRGFEIVNAVPILLETSPGHYGGDLSYSRYKTNAVNLLLQDPNAIVTSLIDYYALRPDFPGYTNPMANAVSKVLHIEQQIEVDINNHRMLPYIQLHEFEALLFADIAAYNKYFPAKVPQIQYIISQYPNPEDINNNPATAPSARMKNIFGARKYKKTFHGPLIALENGIDPILEKCSRFKIWVDKLVAMATSP